MRRSTSPRAAWCWSAPASSASYLEPSGSSTSRCPLTCSTAPGRSRTASTSTGSSGWGCMPARRLFTCRPMRSSRSHGPRPRTPRVAAARRITSRGTTWGCGTTTASRPQRARISAAAPCVSVISASAAGTRTSRWRSCASRSRWWGLRRSWTVKTSGLPRRRSAATSSSRSVGAAGVEAEVEVEDVEVVGLDPGGVEHHRGPPLLRGRPRPAASGRAGAPDPSRPRARGDGRTRGWQAPRR